MTPLVIIPLFNHAATVVGVVRAVQAALPGVPVLVIDDGSTDGAAEALHAIEGVRILRHQRNRGKGAALRTAFEFAAGEGFTHALTVDADGQHDPADVARVLEAARAHPAALVIGERDMTGPEVPPASRRGRDAARFWMRVQTGRDIPDTQCGLRAYPLPAVMALPQRFKRYDFETEILARLCWSGVSIERIPVRCIYFPRDRRVTHFRPLLDTARGVWVNVFLVLRRLMPLPFPKLGPHLHAHHVHRVKWWKFSAWRSAITDALRAGASAAELSLAFAIGVLIGLSPLFGMHSVLAIYFSRRLHLNAVAALLGTQISIAPLAPVWMALSLALGHLLLTGRWILADSWHDWNPRQWTLGLLGAFLLGNFLLAVTMSLASLVIARLVLAWMRPPRTATAGSDA